MRRACAAGVVAMAVALVLARAAVRARMRDPRPTGEYKAAAARAKDVGNHLAASLVSTNLYERLLALEQITAKPGTATPDLAAPLAALVVDRTKLLSLMCMRCQTACADCDACWGLQGNSDCGWLRELGVYAQGTVWALANGPLRAPLADALWSVALRADADAEAVATLMPAFAEALRVRVPGALDTPDAGRALRLLESFPPGQCGDSRLAATLARLVADGAAPVPGRAAVAILVCGDGSPPWAEPARAAITTLSALLPDPRNDLFAELPAVAPVVEPLAGAIGRRMADRTALDGRQGVRLLAAAPTKAAAALPGLRARLQVADDAESLNLFMLIAKIGRKAAPLKPAVIACARRTGAVYWAVVALGKMRVHLSSEELDILRRVRRRRECGNIFDECEPFSQLIKESFSHSPGSERAAE